MADWTHHRASINGIEMHYVTQGEGPLVVLLHGFPHTWFSWRHQIGALAAAGYRVVAPDLRGMGQTDVPEALEEYRVDRVVADVADCSTISANSRRCSRVSTSGSSSPTTSRSNTPTASAD
ncbi:alpha/beta fold hydrolase [Jongsikchunia kroppenstedtii]|uniref:alpha/beta fold hydrolase n=1 Tax=Jongsikchunia kroppenstedtii TaxID=1121721 RepID=UPI00039C54B7|nr:alpha/beta fold hydrolase [Jongsikchunia kroppenstedtii]